MKILYVWWGKTRGPFDYSKGTRAPDEYFVESAARNLGIEVVRTHYQDAALIEKAQQEDPDIVLFSHPPNQYPYDENLPRLREAAPDAVFALLSFDLSNFEGDAQREDRYRALLKHLDVFCTKETGRRVYWEQRGVNTCRAVQGYHPWVERVWKPHAGEGPDPRPVVFFGCYTPRRDQILGQLQDALGNDLMVYSQTPGWKRVRAARPGVFGPARAEAIKNASCAIDVSNGPKIPGYYSDRILDMMAYGIPTLAESGSGRHGPEFLHGSQLVWWTNPASLPWWIMKIRGDVEIAQRLSERGAARVRKHFSYESTVREVVDSCSLFREAASRPWVSSVTEKKPKRSKVLVLGQWRPQGLGYIAKRIVESVETAGGRVSVASVNENPEWDRKYQYDRRRPPPEDTESIIFLEKCDDAWLQWARERGVQTIYMPMWELFRDEPEVRWARSVDIVTAIPAKEIELKIGKPVRFLDWDPGIQPRRPLYQEVPCFFHDARGTEQGKYDLRPRQNTKNTLKAYKKAEKIMAEKGKEIRMILRVKNRELRNVPVSCLQTEFDDTRDYLFSIIHSCSVALAPSGPEGVGLPTFEYQALGLAPIVLDAPPANRIVVPGVSGWLVGTDDMGSASLARKWEPNVEDLTRVIVEAADVMKLNEVREGAYDAALARVGLFDRFLMGMLNE